MEMLFNNFYFLNVIFAGMLSHQLKQHVIDGEKTIIQNPTDQQRWETSVLVLRSPGMEGLM